jgi:hypothetical protein
VSLFSRTFQVGPASGIAGLGFSSPVEAGASQPAAVEVVQPSAEVAVQPSAEVVVQPLPEVAVLPSAAAMAWVAGADPSVAAAVAFRLPSFFSFLPPFAPEPPERGPGGLRRLQRQWRRAQKRMRL